MSWSWSDTPGRSGSPPRCVPSISRWAGSLLALRDQRFEGRACEIADLHTGGRLPAKRVLVVGLGSRADSTAEVVRRAAGAAARRGRDLGAATLLIPVLGARARGLGLAQRAQATGEGVLLGLYRFDRYKEKRNGDRAISTVTLLVPTARDRAAAQEGSRRAELGAEATTFARDLINEPANAVTASALAETGKEIAREAGLRLRVLDRAACEKMGMGAFLGVNSGSVEPPQVIHLAYVPAEPRAAGSP